MKIAEVDRDNNTRIQTNATALGILGLRPFNGKTFLTARGNLVNPLGGGWAWICPFGTTAKALFEDLCDVEAAEKAQVEAKARKRG